MASTKIVYIFIGIHRESTQIYYRKKYKLPGPIITYRYIKF